MKNLGIIMIALSMSVFLFFTGVGHAQTSVPYLVGFMSDLTGRQSNLGIANKRGLEIAVESVNAAGGINGRQLKAVFYDGESDTAKGVIHTKRLIEVDKAVVLAGYGSSATAMAV